METKFLIVNLHLSVDMCTSYNMIYVIIYTAEMDTKILMYMTQINQNFVECSEMVEINQA